MSEDVPSEIAIKNEADIVLVRRVARQAATQTGFGTTDVTRIVTASSELARNIYKYAREGTMRWRSITANGRAGIELQFEDHGPGIPDIDQAMEEGYSSSGGLGMGLPGAKRLVDEMEIRSKSNEGTTVTLKKWLRQLR